MFVVALSSEPVSVCNTQKRHKCDKIPVYANHQGQVLPAESVKWFAHAEHSTGMLPSMRVLLQLHGNLLQSGVKSKEEITSQKV